jgi:pantoate--beta-alanine ligase
MGALHRGHFSLIEHSIAEQQQTLVSIFVNPTQFNDPNDCAKYPNTLEADLGDCERAGVSAVFLPDFVQMYPDDYRYKVTEREQSLVLEGQHRPGHFDGVLTIVLKLLLLARAQAAYFGEKDWQQLRLVEGLVEAFFLETRIRRVATMRETDGLAMSSRNVRLGGEARGLAPLFHRALREAVDCEAARRTLETAGFTVEYIEEWEGRRLGAVLLDGVRLIDNVAVGEEIQG